MKQHACKYAMCLLLIFAHTHCEQNVQAQLIEILFPSGTRHRPDSLSHWPIYIVVATFLAATFFAVNITAQPMSHIFPTESSDC
jgi:hypothetical protein